MGVSGFLGPSELSPTGRWPYLRGICNEKKDCTTLDTWQDTLPSH